MAFKGVEGTLFGFHFFGEELWPSGMGHDERPALGDKSCCFPDLRFCCVVVRSDQNGYAGRAKISLDAGLNI
jgi:hypothetical protein